MATGIALTSEELQARVSKQGIICDDGVWRPYKLLSHTGTHYPATILCPKYGEWTISQLRTLWKYNTGHPAGTKEKKEATFLKKYGVTHPLKSKIIQEKTKQTFLRNYGVDNPLKSSIVKEKVRKTCLERYGVEHVCQSVEFKKQSRKTCMEKFGVPYSLQAESVKNKIIETNMKNYGVPQALQSTEVKNKVKATNMERYGVENSLGSVIVRDKAKQTFIENYGVDNPTKSLIIQEKTKQTCIKKYGTNNPMQNSEIKQKAANTIQRKIEEGTWFNRFGKAQKELQNWVETVTGKLWNSNRTILQGKELDLYNEELKIAIEYCGLYWHNEYSQEPKTKTYHYNKYLECKKQNIKLITIFEDEWLEKKAQVKNHLKTLLGIYDEIIETTNVHFCIVTTPEALEFLHKNSIQAPQEISDAYYGLRYKENLVSVISTIKNSVQRLVTHQGIYIPNGSKILIENILSILNTNQLTIQIDNRWGLSEDFKTLGFTKCREIPPSFTYVTRKKRVLTTEKPLPKIWDCGKTVLEFKKH